jgi:type IV pilus assembly protein PilW
VSARRPYTRGFTLVELLVGSTVSTLVLVAVAASVLAINNAYQRNGMVRQVTESSRVAFSFLERSLRLAGYGLPPELAFSFDPAGLPGVVKDNFTGTIAGQGGSPGWGTFVTDDLAFRYRDSAWMRRGSLDISRAPYALSLQADTPTFGKALPAGQPIMVACSGAQRFFVGRLQGAVAPESRGATLVVHGWGFDTIPPDCVRNSSFIMLVHEKRVRVIEQGGRPYLVVFHSWDPRSEDYDPLAMDVESFQVTYLMNRPSGSSGVSVPAPDASASRPNWVLGDETSRALLPDPNAPRPTYDTPYQDPLRFTAHPTNIRGVQLGLTVRAPRQLSGERSNLPQPLGNYLPPQVPDGYLRSTVETTLRVPNMNSRAFFTPALRDSTNTSDRNNVWGG